MDVDEDEEGTQQVKKVADYGIEVDFESLDEDEREVRALRTNFSSTADITPPRTTLLRKGLSLMLQ